RCRSRKQRGGMPVLADAEEDEIELGETEGPPFTLEFFGRALRISELSLEAKQAFRFERLLDHPGIRLRIVHRYVPFVDDDPRDGNFAQLFVFSEELVQRLGGHSA